VLNLRHEETRLQVRKTFGFTGHSNKG